MPCAHGKNPWHCPECLAAKKPGGATKAVVVTPTIRVLAGTQYVQKTPQQWYESFLKVARQFTQSELPLMKTALVTLAGNPADFASEAELQRAVMAIVVEARRPKLGSKPVTIGIPYRGDGRGKAIVADAERVRDGSLCDVVVLVPDDDFGGKKSGELVGELVASKVAGSTWTPGRSLRAMGLDAIYVSGGPHDHPQMTGLAKNSAKKTPREDEAVQRHAFENDVIRTALAENLPILGICGGSWRLAAAMGAGVARLGSKAEKTHNRPMNQPQLDAHMVEIKPLTMLNQILQTDNYLRFPGQTLAPKSAPIHANSVHWAQSVIPISSPLQIVARDPGEVTEAFETKGAHHFVMGVQWHPEYAMDGLGGTEIGDSRRHRQVLRAIGDAAQDGKAATTIQKHWRGLLARRKAEQLRTEQTT